MLRSAHKFIHLSADALRAGRLDDAIALADKAIKLDNGTAEAFSIRGIALAQKGDETEAVVALRKALMLQPNEPRYSYNVAVMRFATGDLDGARTAIREARKVDPGFEPAKALEDRILKNDRTAPANFLVPEISMPLPEQLDNPPVHAIPYMTGMERIWMVSGWCLVALGIVAGVMFYVYKPIHEAQKIFGQAPLATTPGAIVTIFLLTLSGILTGLWMLTDIVDKRERFIWMIPIVVCCSAGLHALPQALYMAMRRK